MSSKHDRLSTFSDHNSISSGVDERSLVPELLASEALDGVAGVATGITGVMVVSRGVDSGYESDIKGNQAVARALSSCKMSTS